MNIEDVTPGILSSSAIEEFAFGRMVQGSVSAVPDEGETLRVLGAGVLALDESWRRQRAA